MAERLLAAIVFLGAACGPRPPPSSAPAPSSTAADAAAAMGRPITIAALHEQVAGEVLAALRDHDFDGVERRFDLDMQKEVPKAKIDRLWSRVVGINGDLLSWSLSERVFLDRYDRLRYALTLEHGNFEAIVTFTATGTEVAGLLLVPPSGQ